ncbi:putative bifunctional diguanylate cyclase/phosphodiesterase [Parazoarcus communis]|nr:EAL domain-containing protein [Parazoarcus communis]
MNEPTKTRLLVVEDDPVTRGLLRSVLSKQGYDIVEAADGAAGVAAFAESRPALVLLDVMMPVMDGHEACRRIRELDGDEGTPVIILTAAEDIDAIDTAFNAGATDFIIKPISWPLLTQRLRYALRGGRLAREVRQNRLRQSSATRIAGLGFWEWDPRDDELAWSERAPELLGTKECAPETIDALIRIIAPEDRERCRNAFDAIRRGEGRLDIEFRLQADKTERIIRVIGERGVEGSDSNRLFGAFQNITDSRRAEALVDYLAMHDDLTGLGNRRLFSHKLEAELDEVRGSHDGVLLVSWIDLARFHRHNDALGEAAGNRLLVQVAQRLKKVELLGGEVARVGGDEFAVLLRGASEDEVRHRLEQILETLEYPMHVDGQEAFLSLTAGIALYPVHGHDVEQLINLAQEAQRAARHQGKTVEMASQQASHSALAALDIERALRRALEKDEFHLVYQPQMDLRVGKIVGAEALLRWQHPERGLMSPVEFIPVLEEIGLISAVGQWVLKEGCRQAQQWDEAGLGIRVGINLSARQFLDPALFDVITGACEHAGASPKLIELEITESLAMQDPEHSIDLLRRLRETGFRIAIDDFGIGYSSLEYLLRFPLDTIKIDRAFVSQITDARADRAIVRAITAIAQTLGLSTIAEGIETLRQCDFIEALGVSEIQGYLIGKPMTPADFEHLVRTFQRPA